jgi:hypothetical protein
MGKPLRETALFRTITGKNKTGKFIHSVIDVSPLPNFHEVFKARLKDNPNLSLPELAKESFKSIDWFRTIAGVAVVIAYLKGWVSAEQLGDIKDFILQLLPQ